MHKLLSVVLILCVSSSYAAEPPKLVPKDDYVIPSQTIKGLDKPVAIGNVVQLSLSKIDLAAPLVSYDEVWSIFEVNNNKLAQKTTETFINSEGSKVVIFGSGTTSKTFFVNVAVTYLYVVKDNDKITKVASKTVVLSGELVIGDGTDPLPPPTPATIPDGKFGLTKLVYNTMNTNVKEGKVLAGKAVASGYDSVVARIKDKTLTNPEEILKEAGSAANNALKGLSYDKEGYKKASDDVQNKLVDLYTNQQLKVADDYAGALEALSQGLKLLK